MKPVIAVLLGVGIVGTAAYAVMFTGNTMEVVNSVERVEIEKEVTVDALEVRIKEAQEAARADIEAKADEARTEYINNEMKTIEAAVLAEVESELEARRVGLEKETGAY